MREILTDAERAEIKHLAYAIIAAYTGRFFDLPDSAYKEIYQKKFEKIYLDHINRLENLHTLEREDREKILKFAIESEIPTERAIPLFENYYNYGKLQIEKPEE